jgi:hypothetical protein
MKHRKLRIGWSVACGVVAVLLIALWVRSYSWLDTVSLLGKYPLASFQGNILCNKPWVISYEGPTPPSLPSYRYGICTIPSTQPGLFILVGGHSLPLWCSIVLAIGVGIAGWLPQRFSLRTLLIATTLVAVGLGLIVWAVH